MTGQEKSGLLMQVTAWTGLTIYNPIIPVEFDICFTLYTFDRIVSFSASQNEPYLFRYK
jgi:hypothetical protein